jgi:endonuclease YncB( thermonuclease family)
LSYLLVYPSPFLLVCLVAPSHAVAERVARVIDGDTILLEDARKVVLAWFEAGPKEARDVLSGLKHAGSR